MEENVPSGSECCFCGTTFDNEPMYGKFYKIEEITTHYFCLLLSSKVQQRGSDEEGILGFLAKDIRNEIRRGKNVTCKYCGKRGATISCHYSKCKAHFHLPCGRTRDTFHQFFGEFKSFCCKHRKTQKIKQAVLTAMSGKQSICSICLESVPATPSPNTLWAPCCSKDAWFHRLCIQRLALSAGYFFKCPLCNNTAEFVESMRSCGIWIPEQDASWERDPERYEGLLQRHNSCDAKSCRCRQGRTFHLENTKWEIKLCSDCGSQGLHVHCGNLRVSHEWICSVCSNIIASKGELQKTGKISRARDALMARNRIRRGLPIRPQRVTRQHQTPLTEEGEEDEKPDEAAIRKKEGQGKGKPDEDTAPRADKEASSTPQKGASAPTVPDATARLKDTRNGNQPPAPQDENSDVEIIESLDDEIQILPTPNIRFIKTNSGLSVPVVKVHATQPLGEEVVASGEPCQPTSCSDKDAHVDNDNENQLDVCQPSTSQSSDDESGIMCNETLQPNLSDDDDIIVEFEQSPQASVLKQMLQTSVRNTNDQTDIVEKIMQNNNAKEISVPAENTSKSLTSDSSVEHIDAECLPLNIRPLTQSTLSGLAALGTQIEVDRTTIPSSAQLSEPSLIEASVTKDEQKFTAAPGFLTNMYYNRSKPFNSASVVTSMRPQQSGLSVLQSETFTPPVSAVQSMAHLTPNMTTSASANSTSPEFSESIETDTDMSDMSAWRSKIMNLVRARPSLTVISSTIPKAHDTASVQPPQVPLISERGVRQPSARNRNRTIDSFFTRIPNKNTSSKHSNSLLRENSNQIQNSVQYAPTHQMIQMLQNRTKHDDWSVQLVPGDQMTAGSLITQQPIAEEHPDVVFERYSGPVPRDLLYWEQPGGSSEQSTDDDIIVVDDDEPPVSALPLQAVDGRRERKQKLVERQDFNQCISASNPHSMGDPRRMNHLPAIANGVTRPMVPGFTLTDPTSSVAAMTGASNIYILVNPVLTPSRILRTSSQDFYQP